MQFEQPEWQFLFFFAEFTDTPVWLIRFFKIFFCCQFLPFIWIHIYMSWDFLTFPYYVLWTLCTQKNIISGGHKTLTLIWLMINESLWKGQCPKMLGNMFSPITILLLGVRCYSLYGCESIIVIRQISRRIISSGGGDEPTPSRPFPPHGSLCPPPKYKNF